MSLATHLARPADEARIRRAVDKLVSGLPKSARVEFVHAPDADLYAVAFDAASVKSGVQGLKLGGLKKYLVLDRPPYYWMKPWVGKPKGGKLDLSAIEQGQFLLAETGRHRYTLILPLIAGDLRASLKGTKSGALDVRFDGGSPKAAPTGGEFLLIGEGHEPYSLVRQAMAALRDRLGTFRLTEEKPDVLPRGLGWCTWNAFYKDVTESKLLEGLRSFRHKGVPLSWCLLDDGWQSVDGDHLVSFAPDAAKFPHGLGPVIEHAKGEGLVHQFGVWHALQGYWAGIKKGSSLDKRYRTLETTGNIRPWNPRDSYDLRLVHPDDAHRFYHDFHSSLRDAGVDLVKIDGQSATELFSDGTGHGRVGVMRALQHASQSSALLHFHGRLLHCMCHGSDVLLNMLGTTLYRSSDDYFPDRPASHAQHMVQNALVSLWTHTVAVPDWDMFWSDAPEGAWHAAGRALSGGPVYISDKPGTQNAALLWSLLDDCGMVCRVDRAGLPANRTLFVDHAAGEDALLVTNTTGEGHLLLGAFNCSAKPITTTVHASDVPEYDDSLHYVAYLRNAGVAVPIPEDDGVGGAGIELTLDPLTFEILAFAPVHAPGVAALGLKDKLIPPAVVEAGGHINKTTLEFRFTSGGTALFHCRKQPKSVDLFGLLHHKPTKDEVRWNKKTGILEVDLPRGGEVCVRLEM